MAKGPLQQRKGESVIVMGKNSVKEVLRSVPERVIHVFLEAGRDYQDVEEILALAEKNNLIITKLPSTELDKLAGSSSHQAVLAKLTLREPVAIKDLLNRLEAKEDSLLLLLDGIMDPQNLGAVIRAAECFGVDGVIWSKNRGAKLTPVVTKASVGASELVPLVQVSNLAQAVEQCMKGGYWIVGADSTKEAQSLNETDFSGKIALVMGAEGRGLSELIRKKTDYLVRIPMFGRIDSLNVSQATSVILYTLRVK